MSMSSASAPALNDANNLNAGSHLMATSLASQPDDPKFKLPPCRQRGLPLVVFQLIRILLCLFPFDAWVLFPLLFALIIFVIIVFIALVEAEFRRFFFYALVSCATVFTILMWLRWARTHPVVPDEDQVARFTVNHPPAAPLAPLRGQLLAKQGPWFWDQDGRRVLLRGINCVTKCPASPASQRCTHIPANDEFYQYQNVSFVGRPFPLEEADLHLSRLRAAGLTFLRFLITWEAVEHAGPGIYDEEYLDYLRLVLQKCRAHGMAVVLDAHQDVWSRWTGGDGAPAWTLEKVGFCLQTLHPSGAALTQQHWNADDSGKTNNNNTQRYPKMVWNSNNARLAAGTMWTLFFAGNDFAPQTLIDGEPVQEYLQRHFCNALAVVAQAVKDEPAVVGFDILNEPSVGFVGVHDVRDIGPNKYYVGWRVDPWSAMKMGAQETCTFEYFSSFMYLDGKKSLNKDKVCAWRDGPTSCVWHQNGVWEMDASGKPRLLKPFHFAAKPDTAAPIDFLRDYGIPFWRKAAAAVRQYIPDAIIFAEPILDMTDPSREQKPDLSDEDVGAGYVWAPHYYDGMTLMTKSFSRYLGMDSVTQRPSITMEMISKSYALGISKLMHEARHMGSSGCPVLIGECGIPFDLGGRDRKPIFFSGREPQTAFETGDFSKCTTAMDRTMKALENAAVSYTIWCYQPENTNANGDGWNGEDLSLFSRDQVADGDDDNLFAGGRSLNAIIRPYPCRIAGDLVRFSFRLFRKDRRFRLVFKPDHQLAVKETEIFLPRYQYPYGVKVIIDPESSGSYQIDWQQQRMVFKHSDHAAIVHIKVLKVLETDTRPGSLNSIL